MKRSELFFDAILVPLDFFALVAASVAAYYLRVSPYIQRVRPATFTVDLPLTQYLQLATIVATIIIAIFALQGMYVVRSRRRAFDELTRILSGISIGVMLIIVYSFLSAELFQSRFIILAAYAFALVFVTMSRFIVRRIQQAALHLGYGVYRVVLIGNGRYGHELARVLRRRPELGYRVVGELDQPTLRGLEAIYQARGVDELIQTNPAFSDEENLQLLDFCEQYKIDYKYVPNLFETQLTNVRFRQLGQVPIVELLRTPLDGWGRIVKRSMDVAGALGGIIILSPLLIFTALAIKFNSPGPILYKQTRLGRHRQPFFVYKFRSMKAEYCTGEAYGGQTAEEFEQQLRQQTNERTGPLFKMRRDPRVTPVGRIMRRLRIDELPQLLNVLRGEMSLLGPRPHLPKEVEHYTKHHRKLFTIKPGMSGMAQVNGNAGLPFEEEAKLDIGYIENWSLRLDIILILKTIRLLLTDKNAV